jgi:hypothetical protein
VRIEEIEKRVKPPEPFFVVCSFDETDLELDARLREVRQHGLAPNSAPQRSRAVQRPRRTGKIDPISAY